MLISDCIKMLEEESEKQEKYRDMFGEPTITLWTANGFTQDFELCHTPDGVYAVLIQKEVQTDNLIPTVENYDELISISKRSLQKFKETGVVGSWSK